MTNIVHEVKQGDTLSKIAQEYGVSIEDILAINSEIKNPSMIKVGQKINIPNITISVSMHFDGKTLAVTTNRTLNEDTSENISKYQARSGLPKGSPSIPYLNSKHNLSLKMDIDYTQPRYDNVSFAGPIPDGWYGTARTYYLKLSADMTYQKTGGGWGVGGWILQETFLNSMGGRNGFFLHHDGGNPGTAGCIGLVHGNDMHKIRELLRTAHKTGQREVTITVQY